MRDRRPRDRGRKPQEKYAINEHITASEVLLIDGEGEQVGVVPLQDALARAEAAELDLVQVAADATPPVCKLLDYGKLKYKERKKAAEAKKHTASQTIKEIRVRYRTDTHDLETKVRNARKFLLGGDRVKFQMRFRGREVAYKDLGDQTFDQIVEQLADIASVEQRTSLMGHSMNMTLVPTGGPAKRETRESA